MSTGPRFGIEMVPEHSKRDELSDWLVQRVRPMFEGRVLPVCEEVMLRWRLLVEVGRKSGHTFPQPDLIIAATALQPRNWLDRAAVGLLAAAMLRRHPGAAILHDPRLTWNTREIVQTAGGVPVMTKTGHAFIKERMRQVDAVYGGEMSAHHYFRDFGYCDSGMLPWLLITQLMSLSGKPLSALCDERMTAFPVSGENIPSDTSVAGRIVGEDAEHILNQ